MKYVGTVTEVNQHSGYVHLANREFKQAASFLDRSGRFEVGDIVHIEAAFVGQRMTPTTAPTFLVKPEDASDWEHCIVTGVKVTNHVQRPRPHLLSPDPALQPQVVHNPGTASVTVSGRAVSALSGLVGTQWKSRQDGSVVQVTQVFADSNGRPRCRVNTLANGSRARRVNGMEVAHLLAKYDEHVLGYVQFVNGQSQPAQASP